MDTCPYLAYVSAFYDFTFMWTLKHKTNEQNTDRCTDTENWWLPEERGLGGWVK